jgi:hypothetical protein
MFPDLTVAPERAAPVLDSTLPSITVCCANAYLLDVSISTATMKNKNFLICILFG